MKPLDREPTEATVKDVAGTFAPVSQSDAEAFLKAFGTERRANFLQGVRYALEHFASPPQAAPAGDVVERAAAVIDDFERRNAREGYSSYCVANALAAASILRQPAAVPEWLPIESAPKDGNAILVCNKHYTEFGFLPLAVRWRTYHPNAKGNACWRDINGHKVEHVQFWQPLPAAPSRAPGKEGA